MNLPYPGMEPGSPALQVDSLPTELSGKPILSTSEVHLLTQLQKKIKEKRIQYKKKIILVISALRIYSLKLCIT